MSIAKQWHLIGRGVNAALICSQEPFTSPNFRVHKLWRNNEDKSTSVLILSLECSVS